MARQSDETTYYPNLSMILHARAIALLLFLIAMVAACRHTTKSAKGLSEGSRGSGTSMASPAASEAPINTAPSIIVQPPTEGHPRLTCNEQSPQEFLINAHYNGRSLATAAARREWKDAVARSIRYRTEQFGYYSGFGSYGWNSKSLSSQMHTIKFFGLSVRLHERIIPALHCVEQALRIQCADSPYQPQALSGLREKNTYFDGDVSNHVYGIAIDIDPLRNPCCNCIEPWRSSPRCQGKKTDLERMDMPICWITVFERYGFYWLGHDALKDTMHFEFLGEPARILKSDN